MDRIRVLHVINSLQHGGAEVNLVRLVQHAAPRIENHVAYCRGGPSEAALECTEARLIRLSRRTHRVRSLVTPALVARLAAYIVRHRIDIVHTHLLNAHVWGALAGRLCGTKVVEHVHDPRYCDLPFLFSRGFPRTRQFEQAKRFARLSHRIVVLTAQNRDFLVERVGIPPERVVMIPNPVPVRLSAAGERSELRRQLGIPEAAVLILGVGRLAQQKNFRIIIDTVRILGGRAGNVLAVIVGEGPMRNELERYCEAQGVASRVRFFGYRADVEPFYGCADFFVQPSLMELQSLAMLEAMRHRLPVLVAERTGCNDELIVHGQNGLLLDPTRPEIWAHHIERLAADPELCRALGANAARTVVSLCEPGVVSGRLEALYVELTAPSRAATSAGRSLGQI